jgi:hypothetical protein
MNNNIGMKNDGGMKSELAVVIVAGCIFVCIGASAQAASIGIEPMYIEVIDGFTVDIKIDPGDDEIMGAQYILHFNNTLLRAINQTTGGFLSHDGASTDVDKHIDNTLGRINYKEVRTGIEDGVTDNGTLATIEFEVRCSDARDVSELRFSNVKLRYPNATYIPEVTVENATVGVVAQSDPPAPFMVCGYVSYGDESVCNNPTVDITNLNTGRVWTAETDANSNYYQIMLVSCTDVIAGEALQFDGTDPDGGQSSTTEHTVTQDEVDAGGLLYNSTLEPLHPGDINGDGEITLADAAITLQMAVRGDYSEIADVSEDNSVTSLDALMILQVVDRNITFMR